MKSHTVISFGDTHSRSECFEDVIQFTKNRVNSDNPIDSVFHVGDIIGHDKRENSYEYKIINKKTPEISEELNNKIQEFNKKASSFNQNDNSKQNIQLNKELQKDNIEINNGLKQEEEKHYEKIIKKDYEENVKPYCEELRKLVGKNNFLYIKGNHDSNIGEDILGKYVTFVEKKNKIRLRSSSGLELIVRGTINSSEITPFQEKMKEELPSEKYDKLFYNHKNYQPEEVKANYDVGGDEFDEEENKRLGDFKSDIMIAHKIPFFPSDQKGSCSQAVKLFDNKQVAAYGGHFHRAYIMKHNNTFSFNGGTKYFVETRYIQADNSDKKVVDYVIFRKYSGKKAA